MKKKGTIFAISGYSLRDQEYIKNPKIDIHILQNIPKRRRVLYIPTASRDKLDYCSNFKKVYVDILGCQVDSLLLYSNTYSDKDFNHLLKQYDLVYIGGGNTIRMLKKWRSVGFDQALKNYYEEGGNLAGMSAGASCWFSFGITDSMLYTRALGFIDYCFRPHYQKDQETCILNKLQQRYHGIVLACSDHTLFMRKSGEDTLCVFGNQMQQSIFHKSVTGIKVENFILEEGTYILNKPLVGVSFQKVL